MKRVLIASPLLILIACSYIVNTDSQDVSVRSEPTGAQITVTTVGGVEVFSGTTPASIKLKRKNKYVVYVELQGYKDKEVRIDQSMETMVIANLLCGGIPGLIVDGLTGAMWKLEPDEIYITLQAASLDGDVGKLYVFISWYEESLNDLVSLPVPLERI